MQAELSRLDVYKELLLVEQTLARKSLLAFTAYTKPDYLVNWHHRLVAEALDRVIAGKCRRLMIFQPPQTGKSELVSRRFPAYAFGKNPDLRIIACSYGASLAQDMSRDCQKVMSTNEYRGLFPDTHLAEVRYEKDPISGRRTHQEKRTQGQFDIVGHKGSYIAAGVGGPIGGKSADIGIIDDPVKNREDAESEIYREKIWSWYISTFSQRQFGSNSSIVCCTTRWHEADLSGMLLKLAADNPAADQWEVISLPALASEGYALGPGDPRTPGSDEPLWPEKYTYAELLKRRAGMGSYDWASVQQQAPAPAGGGLFREEWFAGRFVDVAPAVMRMARGWDTAGTDGGGDWTVGCKIGEEFVPQATAEGDTILVSSGRFFILDVVRKQLGPHGVNELMRTTAELDGVACAQREEKEGGSAGLAVIDARTKTLVGFDHAGVSVTGSKVTRSKPLRAQCEAGNCYVIRAPWNNEFISELCGFPTGKHDDQVDAAGCAFNAVLLEPPPEKQWATW